MSAPDETAVPSAVFSYLESWQAASRIGTILVAFSGGPDSTALLWALTHATVRLEDDEGPRIVAAHLDHRLDAESGQRAEAARALASRLGLADADIRVGSLSPPSDDDLNHARDGIEDWARRRRYEWLLRVAKDESADVVLTAHHADDQAETVALRILYGTGLRGLAGVRPERDLGHGVRLVRPLLSVRRRDIDAALRVGRREVPDMVPVQDPTNADADQPRAFVRWHLLPRLESDSPGAVDSMIRVARAARRFRRHVDERLDRLLAAPAQPSGPYDFLLPTRRTLSLVAFLALPDELRRHALARLHADLGEPLPPPRSAISELERQLDVRKTANADVNVDAGDENKVGVDCGDGLRWTVRRAHRAAGPAVLQLERRIHPRPFTYTFDTPGATSVPEIFASLHVRTSGTQAIEPWMLRGEAHRTGLSLPLGTRPFATVRTRRPGDRLRPLGASGNRKLKDLLIDRKVPRSVRDRLPLLVLDGILAWVPGVTVDERFRLRPEGSDSGHEVWIAEIRLEGSVSPEDST